MYSVSYQHNLHVDCKSKTLNVSVRFSVNRYSFGLLYIIA